MTKLRTFKLPTLVPTRSCRSDSVEEFGLSTVACIVFLFCISAAIASPAQTFTTLHNFDGTDGAVPTFVSLVQGVDENFYGTTAEGGANNDGTVFKITPTGTLTTLHSFDSTDGQLPYAGLIQAANRNFYGTTIGGGANGYGTVFKITPAGGLTTLYSFCAQTNCVDGRTPTGALALGTDGNFYGITGYGGTNCTTPPWVGCGTVFKITPAGKLTTLYSFCAQTNCTDGFYPGASLVQATDGNFYGTTGYGGTNSYGTVFKITPGGTLTTLHSFDLTDGESPSAPLIQATDGNLYGTAYYGGANDNCIYGTCGTVFKITPGGTLTTLHSFDSTDGANPEAPLVQATDGNFYGTTDFGGANGDGTIFQITPAGTVTTLHSFDSTDGDIPDDGLVQATDGNFYGTANFGGTNGDGTVFSLSTGLGPFVETQPSSGKVGAATIILGTNLTGTTSVSFNGTAATFTVVSSSEITTTVPTGATTGKVSVTTPTRTLKSNVAFRVTPQILSFTPPSGPVGTSVTITGVSLTQTKIVTFGGVKATSFTVNFDTQVTATVPTGAKTGKIGIVTLGGTAASATSFTVTTQ